MKISIGITFFFVLCLSASAIDFHGEGPGEPTGRSVGIDTAFRDRFHETFEALRKDRFPETIAKATSVLAMKPDPKNAALLLTCRGVAYSSLHENQRALADFDEAIRLDPTVDSARANRGMILVFLDQYERAIRDLTHTGPADDSTLRVVASLALAYFETGRKDLARATYIRVTRLPVRLHEEYGLRARAYTKLGQYKAASADWTTAKRLKPDNVEALNESAWLAATCPDASVRNGRQAVRDASRACELKHWKDPGDIDTLAAAYAESGDFRHAIEYEKQAIGLNTGTAKVKSDIARDLRTFEKNEPVREERALP